MPNSTTPDTPLANGPGDNKIAVGNAGHGGSGAPAAAVGGAAAGTSAAATSAAAAAVSQQEFETRALAIYDIILNIAQTHHRHCLTTQDKSKNIVPKVVPLVSFSAKICASIMTYDLFSVHLQVVE